MTPPTLELINELFNLATLPDKSKVIFQINQAFLDRDPLQTEVLLQHHQVRAIGLINDDCAHRHMNTNGKTWGQGIEIGKTKYPMHFYG